MRIQSLTLYKTPLDSEYKNVYDDYTNVNDYINFLSDNFQHLDINIGYVKSRKDKNGNFSVVIPNYDSMDLHDYNYMLINLGDIIADYKFAFIVSVGSINDSENSSNRSCILECKLDVWSNNYLDWKNSNVLQKIVRGTFNNNTNDTLRTGAILENYPSFNRVYRRLSSYQTGNNNISVVWQRIYINDDPTTKTRYVRDGNIVKSEQGVYSPEQSMPLCYYIPVGIIDLTKSNKLLTNVTINCSKSDYNLLDPTSTLYKYYFFTVFIGETGIASNQASGWYNHIPAWDFHLKDDKILESNLTMWAPFKFTVEGGFLNQYTLLLDGESLNTTDIGSIGIGAFGAYGFINNSDVFQQNLSFDMNIPKKHNQDPSSHTIKGRDESVNYEVTSFQYPYRYYKIITANYSFPILPQYFTVNCSVRCGCMKDTMARIVTVNDLGEASWEKYITLSSNASFPTSYSQIETFLRQNANRIELKRAFGMTSSLAAITHGIVASPLAKSPTMALASSGAIFGGLTGFVQSELNYRALLKDYENMLDTVNFPSEDPISSAELLDDIIVLDCSSFDVAKENCYNDVFDYHCFGVPFTAIKNIISYKEREFFDVIYTDNAKLNIIGNEDDKKEIEDAFNNGLTKWHLGALTTVPIELRNEASVILRTLDRSVVNIYQ